MGGGAVQVRIPGPHPEGLTVFETMRAEPDGRIALWPLHRARLARGCAAVGAALDMEAIEAALAGLPRGTTLRARVAVSLRGEIALTHAPLPAAPVAWRVVLSDLRLSRDDPWLAIKSSHRPVYDAARAALPGGADEALLVNDRDEVCEGTITSVFLERAGRLLTPPLACGLLPGVLRRSLLEAGRTEEAVLHPGDLGTGRLWCGNALRGLIAARLIR